MSLAGELDGDDARFLRRAIELAVDNASAGLGGPFGCVIVRTGVVIAEGQNRVTRDLDPTAHAEVNAIRAACRALGDFRLDGCSVYASCEPCPMCLGALYWAHPARIVFASTRQDAADAGFDDSLIYAELATDVAARRIPVLHALRDEGRAAFEVWTGSGDSVPY